MLSLHAANAIALSMLFLTGLDHGRFPVRVVPGSPRWCSLRWGLLWSLRPSAWAADQGGMVVIA
jgi:hypothetical protein